MCIRDRFKNLAELKRYIKIGTEFKATSHKYHPDIVGLTRVVTKVQTNCSVSYTHLDVYKRQDHDRYCS